MNYHNKKLIKFVWIAVENKLFTQWQYELLRQVFEWQERDEFLICDMIETYVIKYMSLSKDFCISDIRFEDRLKYIKERKLTSEARMMKLLSFNWINSTANVQEEGREDVKSSHSTS